MKKKKLLIYAHYYTPDVASTGQILKELAEGMLDTFDITVICVVPSYSGKIEAKYKAKKFYHEKINGVKIVRIRVPEFSKQNKVSRIKNIIAYFFGSMRATLRVGHQDYVFSISQPPILGGLLGVWGKWMKRARFIYNIQDFNPEQVMAVGYSKNRVLLKLMMALDKFSCRQSSLVITVGRDLVTTLKERFKPGKAPKVAMINNWTDENAIYPLQQDDQNVISFKKKYDLQDKFIIMYSGNIGLYYDLENIIKMIRKFPETVRVRDGRILQFVFVGAGSVLTNLKDYVREHQMNNVTFIPYQPKQDLIYSLNAADIHWCVSAKGIKGVSCPSKFYGIAAAGKPVLAVLEDGSEIQMLVKENRVGYVSEPGDYETLIRHIQSIINFDTDLGSMGIRSRKLIESELTREKSIRKYADAILDLR
ncbi:glycosyltransferase family 4 protein [Lacticaseibacillus paracasei]|uniref:glycosyltransferase family 4 protein n=1 Tax=Lacticaseibacillus paracasei TaxID=1597 RepID=UPI000FF1A038|nr:glycosyltransferase family 4 protein [Lacticaseibacillus paracasei]RND58138.1 putative glycosyl transferase [Lacticaseibacillus paracasei]